MKQFGIRVSSIIGRYEGAGHLSGDHWESFRRYPETYERDLALREMQRHFPNYVNGGDITKILEKVQREL